MEVHSRVFVPQQPHRTELCRRNYHEKIRDELLKRKEEFLMKLTPAPVDSALENNVSFGFIFLFERAASYMFS